MATKATTPQKLILVFKDGNLINQINYKTKTIAKKNYNYFIKKGMCNPLTGEVMKNLKFELL